MNELQKNIYKIIVSIIETNGILGRFEDKKNYGQDKIIDNSAIRYGILNTAEIAENESRGSLTPLQWNKSKSSFVYTSHSAGVLKISKI